MLLDLIRVGAHLHGYWYADLPYTVVAPNWCALPRLDAELEFLASNTNAVWSPFSDFLVYFRNLSFRRLRESMV